MSPRQTLLGAILVLIPLVMTAAETNAFPPPRKAVECTPRNGLPHFIAKARKGGELKVAYLGGSITAQPGYRVTSRNQLTNLFPNTKFTEIYAAIGGTGSDLGVFRIDHDVYPGKPDLMFVEFAVNDAGAEPADIVKNMEGIVRKTWKAFPECDILFVYTFTEALLPDLKTGKLNRSAATMEIVADHYGIPSIHMGLEAVRLESEGKLIMKAPEAKMTQVAGDSLNTSAPFAVGPDGKIPFAKDGVHPHLNTGHRLYQEAIDRAWPFIEKASQIPAARVLPKAYDPNNNDKTTMVAIDGLTRTGPWTRLVEGDPLLKKFEKQVDSLWKAEPGAELSFRFKGSAVKAYDLLGPDCGKIEFTVDGKSSKSLRIDSYCTYSRLSTVGFASGLEPEAIHEVKVRVLDEAIDKDKILASRNPGQVAKDPAKFKDINWYVGAIFLIGQMAP